MIIYKINMCTGCKIRGVSTLLVLKLIAVKDHIYRPKCEQVPK